MGSDRPSATLRIASKSEPPPRLNEDYEELEVVEAEAEGPPPWFESWLEAEEEQDEVYSLPCTD